MPGGDPYLVPKAPADKVHTIAQQIGLSPDVADDFLKVTGGIESGNQHYDRRGRVKRSPAGALGFSQVLPATAKSYGLDPYDEAQNIEAGLRYFSEGGNDPVRRRIAYLSGHHSGAVKSYDRTGKIPKGGDPYTGVSFAQYVSASKGQQGDPYLVPKAETTQSDDPYLVPKSESQPAQGRGAAMARVAQSPSSNQVRRGSKRVSASSIPGFGTLRRLRDMRAQPPITLADVKRAEEQSPDPHQQFAEQVMQEKATRGQIREQVQSEYSEPANLFNQAKDMLQVVSDPVGIYKKLANAVTGDEVEPEVEKRYQRLLRSQTPEMIAERKQVGGEGAVVRAFDVPVSKFTAGIGKTAAGITSILGFAPNRVSDWMNKRAQVIEESTDNPIDESGNPIVRSLPEKATSAVVGLGLTVTQLAILKRATGLSLSNLMAAEAALQNNDKPLRERLPEIAYAKGMGKILDSHLSRPISAALFGGPTAIQTGIATAEGNMTLEDALLETAVQTGAGAILGGGKPKLREGQNAQIETAKVTPEVLSDVAPTEQAKVSDLPNADLVRTPVASEVGSSTAPVRHVDLQQRYVKGSKAGDFKKETKAQAEERRAQVNPASPESPTEQPNTLLQPANESAPVSPIAEGAQPAQAKTTPSPADLSTTPPEELKAEIADSLRRKNERVAEAASPAREPWEMKRDEYHKRLEFGAEPITLEIVDSMSDPQTLREEAQAGRLKNGLYEGGDDHVYRVTGNKVEIVPEYKAEYDYKAERFNFTQRSLPHSDIRERPIFHGTSAKDLTVANLDISRSGQNFAGVGGNEFKGVYFTTIPGHRGAKGWGSNVVEAQIAPDAKIIPYKEVKGRYTDDLLADGVDGIVKYARGGDFDEVIIINPKVLREGGHKAAVKQALREGKPVPPEVLADYPDLVASPASGVSRPEAKSPPIETVAEVPERVPDVPRETVTTEPETLPLITKPRTEKPVIELKPRGEPPNRTGIARRVEEARRGTEVPPSGEGVGAFESVEHGRQLLADGRDPQEAVDAFKKTGAVSADAMALVRAKHEELARAANQAYDEGGLHSPEFKAAEQARQDYWEQSVRPMQTAWSNTGRAQQGETDIDTGTFYGMYRAFKDSKGREPSSREVTEMNRLADRSASAESQVQNLSGQLAAELDRAAGIKDLPDEVQKSLSRFIDEAKRESRRTGRQTAKKTLDDEAATIKQNIAAEFARLKAQRQSGTGIRPIGLAGLDPEGVIAKQVIKLAKNRVKAGVVDATQLIDDVHGAIKDLADVTKREVAEAILGQGMPKGNRVESEWAKTKKGVASTLKAADVETARRALGERLQKGLTPEDASEVWKYARENYVDKGNLNFADVRRKVASDLGITPDKVTRALANTKATKRISNEMWAKMSDRRQIRSNAENWIRQSDKGIAARAFENARRLWFLKATVGHGAVAPFTHAPANAFIPARWGNFWKNFGRTYQFMVSKGGHERAMVDLESSPNFITAKRAGLANDPKRGYDDYQSPWMAKTLGKLGVSGNRAFDSLKTMRQDMFDSAWNKLTDDLKTPEMARALSQEINASTGSSKDFSGEGWLNRRINEAMFAAPLEASRWDFLVRDNYRATKAFANWKKASPEQRYMAKRVASRNAQLVATYGALLAANQGLLIASGSDQQINFTDPTKSDFLAFKIGGHVISPAGGLLTAIRFIGNLISIGMEDKKPREKISDASSAVFKYGRSKLQPLYGTGADVWLQSDYIGRPLPFSKQEGTEKLPRYTWPEYVWSTQTPIPLAEAARTYYAEKEKGSSSTKALVKSLPIAGVAATGVRVREDFPAVKLTPRKKTGTENALRF